MLFRVTPQHFSSNSIRYSKAHNANLQTLQRQISSGIKLEKPSDSPANMADLLSTKELLKRTETELENISASRATLNQSVTQLISAKDALTRAKSLALDGVQSTEPESIASEVNGILNLIIQIANASDGVNPLYSGVTGTQPFEVTRVNSEGEALEVQYVGLDHRSKTSVGKQSDMDVFYSGSEVFQPKDREQTVYLGNTGAAAGLGVDTAIGHTELLVRNVNTTLAGASGLQSGANARDVDGIIGVHQLSIDGVAMTIKLDDGPAVSFDGTETSLEILGPDGTPISIDTTGYVAGFSGTIDVTGEGVFSLDNGTTEITVDFLESQMWQDPENGRVTYIDTRNIQRAGVDQIEYSGTSDVFETLIQLRDELRNSRELPPGEWADAMQRRIGDVERVHNHILSIVAEQSVSLENLDGIQQRSEDHMLQMATRVDELESTDMVEAISSLQMEQNLLQYTYAVTANIMSGTSLLDFIR